MNDHGNKDMKGVEATHWLTSDDAFRRHLMKKEFHKIMYKMKPRNKTCMQLCQRSNRLQFLVYL